ncbi:uncharacterized protein LOC121983341 [Zingiber officinale]|uniref:ZCF37 n=1 Tax=Zingiber officinale TaxID=94328 RepID=A0A8J5GY25_ZINOF|nr:uncharacterized protein LOC121983341 [Zingiber officinale]KAG6508873.1 hypothetical protein ZIOFF_034255 [Zingiber officinale]
MLCGTGSFKSVDGGETWSSTPPSSPRKKRTKSLNPYSARGLDKFASLIAELEARRAKVMAKAGAQGAATLVRFTYSNSNDWVPIIIRLPDEINAKPHHNPKAKSEIAGSEAAARPVKTQEKEEAAAVVLKENKNVSAQVPLSWPRVKEAALRSLRPRWPVLVAVLMLVCLVVFGRVFAICCTTVGWYLVPAMKGEGAGRTGRKSKSSKTKDYGRRLSSKKSHLK